MFGLVKASRLRKLQAELDIEEKEHQRQERISHNEMLNWRAIAESRLVAVLLLRDRWQAIDLAGQMMQEALNAANAESAERKEQWEAADRHIADQERTIASMDERFNALTAKWEAATAESALNAAQRDDARAASDDRRNKRDEARASAMAELNATLSAISR